MKLSRGGFFFNEIKAIYATWAVAKRKPEKSSLEGDSNHWLLSPLAIKLSSQLRGGLFVSSRNTIKEVRYMKRQMFEPRMKEYFKFAYLWQPQGMKLTTNDEKHNAEKKLFFNERTCQKSSSWNPWGKYSTWFVFYHRFQHHRVCLENKTY